MKQSSIQHASDHANRSWWTRILISVALLATMVMVVYWQCINFNFVPYDDALNITENPHFAVAGSEDWLQFWRRPLHKLYIPLTYSLWATVARLARDGISGDGYYVFKAGWFHALNVILHLINTCWVAAILRLYVRREICVLLASAVFAVHPMMAEPVAWATGLKDLLFCFFALPALYCIISGQRSAKKQFKWLICASFLYVAALLSKPAAAALPLMVVIFGLYEGWSKRSLAMIFIIGCALGAPMFLAVWKSQAAQSSLSVPLVSRPLIATDALAFYFSKILLPTRLLIDYGATPKVVLGQWQVWLAVPFVLLEAFLIWRYRDKGWWLPVGLFVTALTPVLGLVPFEFQSHSTVADRYVYLPMLGVVLALAWCLERTGRKGFTLGILLVSILASQGYRQVGIWSSADKLFSHTLAVNPGSLVAWQSLGAGYMAERRWRDAVQAFSAALALRPRFADGLYNLGLAYEELGMDELALEKFSNINGSGAPTAASLEGAARCAKRLGRWDEVISFINREEKEFPGRPQSAWLRAEVQVHQGDIAGADASYRLAISRQPSGYELRTAYGDFLADHGDPNAAISEYTVAINLAPNVAPPRINLAALLASSGRLDEAEVQLRKAIGLNPNLATAYVNFGMLMERRGRLLDAEAAFKSALHLEPNRADAQLGWARVREGRS